MSDGSNTSGVAPVPSSLSPSGSKGPAPSLPAAPAPALIPVPVGVDGRPDVAAAKTADAAEAAARAQLENKFDFNDDVAEDVSEEEEEEEEEGADEANEAADGLGELVSTTTGAAKPLGTRSATAHDDDDDVPELAEGEGFMLKDLSTGKMIHIVNDIDSFFDDINFTTFEQIREAAENAAKNLHGPTEKLLPPEKIPESEPSDRETDEFLFYLPRGSKFTVQIRAHAFAMDHNRKIYAVYFVDVKIAGDDADAASSADASGTSSAAAASADSASSKDSSAAGATGAASSTSLTSGGGGAAAPAAAPVHGEETSSKPPRTWTVFRRYNHFRALQEKLKKNGYAVPSLPPKRLFKSNFDPQFLGERRQQLEEWMVNLLRLSVSERLRCLQPARDRA